MQNQWQSYSNIIVYYMILSIIVRLKTEREREKEYEKNENQKKRQRKKIKSRFTIRGMLSAYDKRRRYLLRFEFQN